MEPDVCECGYAGREADDRFCGGCGKPLSPANDSWGTEAAQHNPFAVVDTVLAKIEDRQRTVLILRFGLGTGQGQTLDEIGKVIGVTRERVRQIEYRGMAKLGVSRRFLQPVADRLDALARELGLARTDPRLGDAFTKLYPRATRPAWPYLALLTKVCKVSSGADPEEVPGFDAAVVEELSRDGPLPLDELAERIGASLGPDLVGNRPTFSAASRLRLIGPARRRNDGRYDLPDAGIDGLPDKRLRRLSALRGVVERIGPAHFSAIAAALDDCLPTEYRLDEDDVHAWLHRYDDFVWAGQGRYGLASQEVGIRTVAGTRLDPPADGRRRRQGIGDEIAVLLADQGALPLTEVEDHILSRFEVRRNSVEAAIKQDRAGRFLLGSGKVVALRQTPTATSV